VSADDTRTGTDGDLASAGQDFGEQLDRKLAKSRDDASRAATALAELAIAIAERGGKEDTAAVELATRARGLAVRIHAPADAAAALKQS